MPEIVGLLSDGSNFHYRVQREELRPGDTITYLPDFTSTPLHGVILHIGLGQASRNAVWIRCTDGKQQGSVECVMIKDILGYERNEIERTK